MGKRVGKQKKGARPPTKSSLDKTRARGYKRTDMTTAEAVRGQVDAAAYHALPIGQVAEQYGVTVDALRYWDSIGILSVRRVGSIRVYDKDDLEKLDLILRGKEKGYGPKEIRMALQLESLLSKPAISGTRLLREMMAKAERGDTVKEPLPTKSVYNSAYRRLERSAKATGRKVIIRTSEDEKSLEAKIVE